MRSFWGCVALTAATACSSSYVPAQSPRVGTVWRDGSMAYYRDGVEYPSGLFLEGVEDAVKGNPRAEAEARTAKHLMIGGWSCELGALGALGTGVGLLSTSHPGDTASNTGLGLLAGSLLFDIAAYVLFVNAPPHAFDAVNIYNDGVPPYAGAPSFVGPPRGPPPPTNPFMMPPPPTTPR